MKGHTSTVTLHVVFHFPNRTTHSYLATIVLTPKYGEMTRCGMAGAEDGFDRGKAHVAAAERIGLPIA